MMKQSAHHAKHAFSLIEMAMVVAIAGLMVSFGMQSSQQANNSPECYTATKLQLQTVRAAIDTYVHKKDRLPLPSPRNVGVENVMYGREATSPADIDAAGGVSFGALPFQALGLPSSFAGDCWGNKLSYAVTTALTTSLASGGYLDSLVVGNITLKSSAANTINTSTAYAIISHGEDGLGAVKINYSAANAGGSPDAAHQWCSGTTLKHMNCKADAALLADAVFNNGKNAGANYYDDLIITGAKKIIAGASAGNLYCWGTDYAGYGTLADGSFATGAGHQKLSPNASTSALIFTNLAETQGGMYDNYHMCSLVSDGTPYCWGYNNLGQLGDASTSNRSTPTAANTLVKFVKLYVFTNFSCGLMRNPDGTIEGTPYCWGSSGNGTGSQKTSPTAINVGGAKLTILASGKSAAGIITTCGLSTAGDAYCWTATGTPALVPGARKFTDLIVGTVSCGITGAADPGGAGAIYCWGDLGVNTNTTTPPPFFPPISISGITNGNPVVVTTSANHGLIAGDRYVIRFVRGMDYINARGTAFCTGVGVPLSTCTAANTIAKIFNTSSNNTAATFQVTAGNYTANTINIVGLNGASLGSYSSGGEINTYSSIIPRLMDSGGATFKEFVRNRASYYDSTGFSALSTTGQLYSWGDNASSQMGNVSAASKRLTPYAGPNYPSGMTATNPLVVNTSSPHGFSAGDYLHFKQGIGFTQVTDGIYKVGTVTTANQFSLQDIRGVNIDATTFTPSPCCTGGYFQKLPYPSGCYYDGNTWLYACNSTPYRPTGLCTSEPGGQCVITSPDLVGLGSSAAIVTSAGTKLGWMAYSGDNTPTTRTTPVVMQTSTNSVLPFSFSKFFPINMIDSSLNGMCGLSTTNDAYCWGSTNNSGIYGSGDITVSAYPRIIAGGLKFSTLAKISNSTTSPSYGVVCGLKN